jgi:hypothetical protein
VFGAWPPEQGASLAREQFRLRFNYRRWLTSLTWIREEQKEIDYRKFPELVAALDRIDVRAKVYSISKDTLGNCKRNEPAKDSPEHILWVDRRRRLADHHDLMVDRLRHAERVWATARDARIANDMNRPPEYAMADKETQRWARFAEQFARAVQRLAVSGLEACCAVKLKKLGPNNRKRRAVHAARAFAGWCAGILNTPNLRHRLRITDDIYHLAVVRSRQLFAKAGLYHSSCNAEEKAFMKADKARQLIGRSPNCPDPARPEAIAVQLQGGLTFDEVISHGSGEGGSSGEDDDNDDSNHFRLEPLTTAEVMATVNPRHAARLQAEHNDPHNPDTCLRCHAPKITARKQYRAYLRVGINEDKTPKWVVSRVSLDRELPSGAQIQDVRLQRTPVGPSSSWKLIMSLKFPEKIPERRASAEGTIALDIGWRRIYRDDGSLDRVRVAAWVDDRGGSGEWCLPPSVEGDHTRISAMQSTRDERQNALKDALLAWARDHRESPAHAWVADATRGLHQWRSPKRFVRLLRKWQRCSEDEAVHQMLTDWAPWDRRARFVQERLRDRIVNRVIDFQRVQAAQVTRAYGVIVLEQMRGKGGFDLTTPKIAERKYPSDLEDDKNREQRRTMRRAAPGRGRDSIVQAAGKFGAKIVEVKPEMTTQHCRVCGCDAEADARKSVMVICSQCGSTWDQDINAAENLLALSRGEVLARPAAPLARREIAGESIDKAMRDKGQKAPPKGRRRDRSKAAKQGGVNVDVLP